MNKVDYAVLVAINVFAIVFIYKRKNKNNFKENNNFEEEIDILKNAVEFAIDKISK